MWSLPPSDSVLHFLSLVAIVGFLATGIGLRRSGGKRRARALSEFRKS